MFFGDLGQVQLGSRQAGIRPVLVVSSDHRNEYSPVVWVVIITSQIKRLDLKSRKPGGSQCVSHGEALPAGSS
ncbi:type II toxin-antitoxin system PemK/MazF family toxin [Eubacterium pyruvativorans]|uniref:type II toxin-antitoxin system PemK/MazF family toxin n=1 Tax=Eubacterium pyruvativorans TaxID=155865 RepID=UPI003F8CDEB2